MSDILREVASLSPRQRALLELQLKKSRAGRPRSEIHSLSGERHMFPLSFAQQRLWFSDQLEPGNPAYNLPAAFRLEGHLDIPALQQALTEITRRHETLRTTFVIANGQPMQLISPDAAVSFPVIDLSEMVEAERDAEVRRWATIETQHRYDLSCGPLLRVNLLRLGDNDHVLLFTMHHIISDGWSMGVIVRELTALYEAYRKGHPSPLPELTIQYADYAVWQRQWLQGVVLETQLAYWKSRLSKLTALELPTDRPRPAVRTNHGATQRFVLPMEISNSLYELSRQQGVTLFMVLLAAFQALLWRYTGHDDIAVGSPIAGRNRAETESLIGFFINTLVLRTDLSGDPSFFELLQRVREVTLGADANQDVPFEKLVEELQPERQLNHAPWFQVWFVLENAGMIQSSKLPELTLSHVGVAGKTAQFDLTLAMSESEAGIGGGLTYSTDLFDDDTISEMVERFSCLLQGVVVHPEWPLLEIPLDKNQMLNPAGPRSNSPAAASYEDQFVM
jgi:hypothetical protein